MCKNSESECLDIFGTEHFHSLWTYSHRKFQLSQNSTFRWKKLLRENSWPGLFPLSCRTALQNSQLLLLPASRWSALSSPHFPPWPADGTTFVTGFMIAKFCQVCHRQEWFSRLNTQRFFWVSNTVTKNTPSVQSALNIKL